MTGRKIVVDGVQYLWKYGHGYVEVRKEGRIVVRVDTAGLLDLTNNDHERAIWKRTMDCAVTPGRIADLIRKVDK